MFSPAKICDSCPVVTISDSVLLYSCGGDDSFSIGALDSVSFFFISISDSSRPSPMPLLTEWKQPGHGAVFTRLIKCVWVL